MRTALKKILALSFLLVASLPLANADTFTSSTPDQPYCNNPEDCNIDRGTAIVANNVNDIRKDMKFSDYVQVIASYFMIFVAVLGVLYIIYAGFTILTSSGDDGKVKKSKTMIFYVLMGIILMFLAFPIIKWAISLVNAGRTGFEMPQIIEKSYAYTLEDKNTFDEYKKKAELLASDLERDYKVNGKISTSNLQQLQSIVSQSIDTFPDDDNYVSNSSIAKNLLISIDVVKKRPDSDAKITELAKNLNDYLTKIKIPRISAKLTASPQSGSAPLTTTLRASDVIDPSGVVIPKGNYVWWIKLSDGSRKTLGTGPSINFTFKEEKNYLVNLDITSASRNNKGKIDVLPFSQTIKIDALPSVGNIYFYINGINVSDLDRFKITPNIGKAGLLLDATASQPAAGSKFVKTSWAFGNGNTTSYDLYPRMEKQYYVSEGNYRIVLTLTTNEGKQITKNLDLEVRDPVASIKTDKTSGFVGDDFKMNVSTAFVDGRLNYEWRIVELGQEQPIYTSSKENITYKFRKTGKFAVKLKSMSPSGKEDTDTTIITIESRDPIATFDVINSNPETPNAFKFDASSSYDPDTFDISKLTFSWIVDGQKVELENPGRNGAVGRYTFDTEGNHKVVLEVSNQEGKVATVKKDVNVTSLLSVKVNFTPKIVKMNNPIAIVAESKNATVYEWTFGDGETDTTNNGRITHTYKKAGNYDMTLTVRGRKTSDSNSISRRVYVADADSPMAVMTVKRDGDEVFMSPDACDGNDAYVLDRASTVTFSAQDSTNVDGSNTGLMYSWKYIDRTSGQSNYSYKFDELGCFPVVLTVKSQKNGKMSSVKNYVKIENLPPKVAGLTVTATDLNSDPVIVRVSANNPHDDDGVITSYLWYYYTDSDPEPQDYRVTKLSSTTFVLPKVTGKYYFVLIAEDSNGAKINTDQIGDDKYTLQLATDNVNTPIIKLSADKTSIATGEEVNFVATVTDVLGHDISDKVEYKWDFDGDGFYDETTKSGKISHKFSTPGNINFKVKITHKGISNTKFQLISVKNILKPNFEYYAIGSKIVLFNTTDGVFTTASWDLGNGVTSTNLDSFTYDFKDEPFPKTVTLKVSDGQSTKSVDLAVRKDVRNQALVNKQSSKLVYFTYPNVEDSEIHISRPGDRLFVYLGSSKVSSAQYCIDIDLTVDTDLNGAPDDDCDNRGTDSYVNGTPFVIKDFDNQVKDRIMRLSLLNGTKTVESKEIKVILDYSQGGSVESKDNKEISDNDRKGIEELKDLIKKTGDKDKMQMMQYLNALQENWFDDREKTKTIIDFESYVNASSIDSKLKDEFYNVLEGFLLNQNQAKDEVSLAAKVLKSLIPKSNPQYTQIMKNIDEILSHPTNTKLNKDLGKFILDSIKNDDNIPNKDKVVIKSQLQVIIYGSQKNIPEEVVNQGAEESGASTGSSISGFISGFIKVFLWIILLLIGGIIVLFILFRFTNKNENLSFQDYIIDLFFQNGANKEKPVPAPPVKPAEEAKPKSDILASFSDSGSAPAKAPETPKSENIKEPEQSQANEPSTGLPDWLKGASAIPEEPAKEEPKTEEAKPLAEETIKETEKPETKSEEGLPDWLKGLDNAELQNEIKEELGEKQPSEETPQAAPQDESGLPDWLKGMSVTQESEKPKTEENSEGKDAGLPDWLKGDDSENKSEEEIPPYVAPVADEPKDKEMEQESAESESELPDWLKGLETSQNESDESKDSEQEEKAHETKEAESETPKPKKEKSSEKQEKHLRPIPKKSNPKQPKAPAPTDGNTDDDLPDWLK